MPDLSDELLGYALAQAHPLVQAWRGEKLSADLRAACADAVRALGDDAEAQRVARIMQALALPACSYKGHLLNARLHGTSGALHPWRPIP